MQINKFNWESYSTDKNMSGHGYNISYERFLSDMRFNVKKVVEIGTRQGSIMLWLNYFPNCKLYGIDLIDPRFKSDRFVYENLDQGNESHLDYFIKKHGKYFDIIIDDGPHTTPEQIISFNKLFINLVPGGVYVIEDLHTTESYDKNHTKYRKGLNYSMLDLLKEFKRNEFKPNKYLYNIEKIKNDIGNIYILKSEKNRWPTNMNEPSEIAFIYKKL